MSITFPSIKPTQRSFSAGVYPTKTYRSLAGTTVKRSFGNKPSAYQLQVTFVNIDDDTTSRILEHYYNTAAGIVRFALPAALFVGMNSTLQAQAQSPDGIRWEYSGPPEVESVYANRSTVSVQFIGEINV